MWRGFSRLVTFFNFICQNILLLLLILKHWRIQLLLALPNLLLPLLLLLATSLHTGLRSSHLLDLLLPLLPLLDIHLESLLKCQPALPLALLSDLVRLLRDSRFEELLPLLFLLLLDFLDFLFSFLVPLGLLADVFGQTDFLEGGSAAGVALGLECAVLELLGDSFLFELEFEFFDVLELHGDYFFTSVLNFPSILILLPVIPIDLRIPDLLQILPLLLNLKILQFLLPLLK